jgi:hypothetical protein
MKLQMRCNKCGELKIWEERPNVIIEFGRYALLDYAYKELVCVNCEMEEQREARERDYDAIAEEAGRRGYEAGLNETA